MNEKRKRCIGRRNRDREYLVLLACLSLFFCWFFVGRFGVFGAKVDWISQHSVLPEYFRQQFYETGQLFPEFAPNIGGGQNIYNFSYYGLLSPVVLLSYALPFVKMGDYLMAAGVVGLTAAVLILYKWLRQRGFEERISFPVALLFLLAGPMIYHSYSQIMFVNYMPFLCMALIGVDQYVEKGKAGLYTISVFLMIMTSFYFSIGGMLVLILYGMHRYVQEKEAVGGRRGAAGILSEGIRFLMPMLTAVLMSGVLLAPTVMALMGRKGRSMPHPGWKELLLPDVSLVKFLYHPYGIGLTALILMVLLVSLTYRKMSEKLFAWSCVFVLIMPVFCYLLNGGLYIRNKVLIPFLPLLCYLTAYYLRKQEKKEIPFGAGLGACFLMIGILLMGKGEIRDSLEWGLLLLDGVLVLAGFLVFQKKRYLPALIVPSVCCLMLFGTVFHSVNGQTLERTFYEEISDGKRAETVAAVLDGEEGFYRMEEYGTDAENAANLNRIRDGRQYSASIYSSTYNDNYQTFRTETFGGEEPFRNFLMQPALANPFFRKVMGVKYVVSQKQVAGYALVEKDYGAGAERVYRNEDVAPVVYATDRLISAKEYEELEFPYNQTALAQYAVVEGMGKKERGWKEQLRKETVETELPIPENSKIQKTEEGYRIQSEENFSVKVPVQDAGILFLEFEVKNHQGKDVSIWLEGVRNCLTAKQHIYYNGNTTFTWAVTLKENQEEVVLKFGKGDYELRNVKAFRSRDSVYDSKGELYQSELEVNREKTKGNRIQGTLHTDGTKYVITSIPYDENFEILVDGKKVSYGKVNTAFLGFPIGKGDHKIEIIYHASGVPEGKLISFLGFLLYAGMHLKKEK